ncbi:MAG: hypothetical protein KJO38_05315 [Gammaproteobacteria bacterium]|nr:hypothetical protein [Gammaproteobacteria bacterium]
MARNQHSYAKRMRDIEKKRKADEKRAKRLSKSQAKNDPQDSEAGTEEPASDEAAESPADDGTVPVS